MTQAMVSMFALCREAMIALSTPLSSSCLTSAFFVGLLFSFFMCIIIRILGCEVKKKLKINIEIIWEKLLTNPIRYVIIPGGLFFPQRLRFCT